MNQFHERGTANTEEDALVPEASFAVSPEDEARIRSQYDLPPASNDNQDIIGPIKDLTPENAWVTPAPENGPVALATHDAAPATENVLERSASDESMPAVQADALVLNTLSAEQNEKQTQERQHELASYANNLSHLAGEDGIIRETDELLGDTYSMSLETANELLVSFRGMPKDMARQKLSMLQGEGIPPSVYLTLNRMIDEMPTAVAAEGLKHSSAAPPEASVEYVVAHDSDGEKVVAMEDSSLGKVAEYAPIGADATTEAQPASIESAPNNLLQQSWSEVFEPLKEDAPEYLAPQERESFEKKIDDLRSDIETYAQTVVRAGASEPSSKAIASLHYAAFLEGTDAALSLEERSLLQKNAQEFATAELSAINNIEDPNQDMLFYRVTGTLAELNTYAPDVLVNITKDPLLREKLSLTKTYLEGQIGAPLKEKTWDVLNARRVLHTRYKELFDTEPPAVPPEVLTYEREQQERLTDLLSTPADQREAILEDQNRLEQYILQKTGERNLSEAIKHFDRLFSYAADGVQLDSGQKAIAKKILARSARKDSLAGAAVIVTPSQALVRMVAYQENVARLERKGNNG